MSTKTPAKLGFAMPAEWEPHEATWLGWPHCRTDWPGKLAAIEWVYGEMVRKIAVGEKVRIVIDSAAREAKARRILTRAHANLGNVEFFRSDSDRGWSRDFGPICVRKSGPRPRSPSPSSSSRPGPSIPTGTRTTASPRHRQALEAAHVPRHPR
jgi:agmatine deiminase